MEVKERKIYRKLKDLNEREKLNKATEFEATNQHTYLKEPQGSKHPGNLEY